MNAGIVPPKHLIQLRFDIRILEIKLLYHGGDLIFLHFFARDTHFRIVYAKVEVNSDRDGLQDGLDSIFKLVNT